MPGQVKRPPMGPVERGVRKELRDLRAAEVAPGLAAQAVDAARAIDGTVSARDKAPLHNALMRVLGMVRAVESPSVEVDALDEFTARRAARGAAAEG